MPSVFLPRLPHFQFQLPHPSHSHHDLRHEVTTFARLLLAVNRQHTRQKMVKRACALSVLANLLPRERNIPPRFIRLGDDVLGRTVPRQ